MNADRTILIAGAGLGGLALAACLLARGLRVMVFEQASLLGEVGAGVQTSANAVKVLDALGLRAELESTAVRPQAFEYRRFDSGELMHRIPLGEHHEAAFGAPYFHIHRADLHAVLARKVRGLDADCIRLGAVVAGFEEHERGVTLRLADGSQFEGDALVGADGIRSVIRARIVGPDRPVYTGDIAWRAVVPVERLAAGITDVVSTVWCGPGRHAVTYYLRSQRLFNFVGCVEHAQPHQESWTAKRPWSELKADYAGWHPVIQAVIDAVDRDACFHWALNNRAPVSNWSTQRATLLGDAAHPTLPYMASGAAMAIEDAAVLARCLAGDEPVPQSLQRYQRNRIERTARVVEGSTAARTLYRIADVEAMRRAFQEQNLNRSRSEWLYNYDPMTVPLP